MRMMSVVVVATSMLSSACRPAGDNSEARDLAVYAGSESDSTRIEPLGRKQHDLLRDLSDHTADPTPLMTSDFTLIDHADTAAANQRTVDGRPKPGQDMFKTLAARLPHQYAAIDAMEAVYDRTNSAVAYVRHPAGERSITHWKFSEGAWRASILILNVEESAFAESRKRRMAGS